jgi:YegS/Rv2252/BmrU family lipid kinase
LSILRVRSALVLVNKNARRGRLDTATLVAMLEGAGVRATLEMPAAQAEMNDLIRREGPVHDAVVVGGGDGTISGTAAALLEVGKPLGILPLGTANDLARTLDIPSDPVAAAKLVRGGHTRRIDLGLANDRYFFNVASMGLSVRLARALDYDLKQKWGVAGYFVALLGVELGRGFRAEITWPEGSTRLRAVQISVGNGRYHGGGVVVAPEARIDDGRLHLYAIPELPLWRLALVLPLLRLGRQHLLKEIETIEAEAFDIRTVPDLRVNTDGEVTTKTPVRMTVVPEALEVFVPGPPPKA